MQSFDLALRPRILLLEDDGDTRHALAQVLEDEHFLIIPVATLDQALQALKISDVSLVLSDFLLHQHRVEPEQTWARLQTLRRAAAPAPMGLITGWSLSQEEARDRGFHFLLTKPFELEDLLAAVATHTRAAALEPAHEQAVRKYFDALTRCDWETLGSLCSPDVAYHLPGTDPVFSRTVQGREVFCAFAEETFRNFPDACFQVEGVVPLPDAVIGRYRGRWRAPDGSFQELPGAVLFHFQGPLISQIGIRLEVKRLWAVATSDAASSP